MSGESDKLERNAAKFHEAVGTLQELVEEAIRRRIFGTIAVEVSFQAGVAHKIRRKIDETVKT